MKRTKKESSAEPINGLLYYRTDEQIAAYKKVPVSRKLRLLEEYAKFMLQVRPVNVKRNRRTG
jgi:hypothetical protein